MIAPVATASAAVETEAVKKKTNGEAKAQSLALGDHRHGRGPWATGEVVAGVRVRGRGVVEGTKHDGRWRVSSQPGRTAPCSW